MTAELSNIGSAMVAVEEVVLCQFAHGLDDDTEIYAEGFQMLSQTGGRLGQPRAIGRCDDGAYYRIYNKARENRAYNLFIYKHHGVFTLLGFTSCHRFSGFLRFDSTTLSVVLDLEGLRIHPWETLTLEGFSVLQGASLQPLLHQFGLLLTRSHPRQLPASTPRGWCSWYHYYAGVSAEDIRENLASMSAFPALEYVQIDDGYQAFMGDWLIPSDRFPGGVARLIAEIRLRGKKAGIWIAPFIAQGESRLFRKHPDWFVQCADRRRPLAAEEVTYGGWRATPWYMLDGTHPGAIEYLTDVIRTMRKHWKVDYFKLDANYWGAVKGGVFHRENATRIEAYREAMEAIRAAADGAFILGCNAPMWPSLGLVDGMRVSDDVERRDERFSQIKEEIFRRNWMHGRLWLNDPDCLVLHDLANQRASSANYRYHLTVIAASGGILMAGDRLSTLERTERRQLESLLALAQERYSAAGFNGFDTEIGVCHGTNGRLLCVTNSAATEKVLMLDLNPGDAIEVVVGSQVTRHGDRLEIHLRPVDGAVIKVTESRCRN